MLRIKCFVLFGKHTLLDKILRVLQLQTHLSKAKKKVVLFPKISQMKNFLSLTRSHSRMCIRKETKEEKRLSLEILTKFDDINYGFKLLDRVVNLSWLFILI